MHGNAYWISHKERIGAEGDAREEMFDSIIIHIPHSSTELPNASDWDAEFLKKELESETDLFALETFCNENCEVVTAPMSRLWVDVEKLADGEPFEQFGRGRFPVKSWEGIGYPAVKNLKLRENYYNSYHKALEHLVDKKLSLYGKCVIVDCHTYNSNNKYLLEKINADKDLPDICIGLNDDSSTLAEWAASAFEGFTTRINHPFSGSYVPLKHKDNKQVCSIMLEVKRDTLAVKESREKMKRQFARFLGGMVI
jgi:N-formylglutamate amidohydrolase